MSFLRTLIASMIGTLVAVGIIILLGTALVIGIVSTSAQQPTIENNSVLSVELSGQMAERTADDPLREYFFEETSVDLNAYRQALQNAADDDRIDVLWLRPQGITDAWATLQEMRTSLEMFKESGKTIIAYSSADGFSEKDYYLASVANRIYTPPEASFELDGFALTVAYYSNLLDDLKIEPQIVRAGEYKAAVEPFTRSSMSPENEEQLSAILSAQNETFMTTLADARGLPVDSLEYLAEEFGIYLAESAYDSGLIDELIYESDVRERLKDTLDQNADEELNTVGLRRYSQASAPAGGTTGPNDIAVVYASGAITTGESRETPASPLGSEVLGSKTFAEAMETATDTDDVKAIVVRVNSPGGSVTASDVMWHSVQQATEEKPVIVSMGDVAASGGYYMSAAADSIVADPLTITGSIGVFGLFFDTSGLFEELGITFDVVKTSPYADAFSGLRSFTPEEMEKYEEVIDNMYEEFLSKVADGRGLSVEEIRDVAGGRVWTGGQAQEIGLVDVLGSLDDATEIAAERAGLEAGEYGIRTLPELEPFPMRLARTFQSKLHSWWPRSLLPADHPWTDHMNTLDELHRLYGNPQARLPYRLNIH
jgi:protease-4